jgi:hypothetical protein
LKFCDGYFAVHAADPEIAKSVIWAREFMCKTSAKETEFNGVTRVHITWHSSSVIWEWRTRPEYGIKA